MRIPNEKITGNIALIEREIKQSATKEIKPKFSAKSIEHKNAFIAEILSNRLGLTPISIKLPKKRPTVNNQNPTNEQTNAATV